MAGASRRVGEIDSTQGVCSLIVVTHVDAIVAASMIPVKEVNSFHHVRIRILIKVHFVIVQQPNVSSFCGRPENRIFEWCAIDQLDLIHCG